MASNDAGAKGRRRPKLRTGFILVVLLAMVVPLAGVGVWLAYTTQRSAEILVQARLAETLDEMLPGIVGAWGTERSRLVRLGWSDAVQEALTEGREPPGIPNELPESVERVVLRDVEGEERGVLEGQRSEPGGSQLPSTAALVPVRLDVHEPWSGEWLGVLEAELRADALLRADLLLPGVAGSVLGVFDAAEGTPILPLALEPELFARDRFEWGGERWVVARHRLYEPPLVLALAGPVGPSAEPLADAARQGFVALALVTLAGLLLTIVLSRRLTRSLGSLAEAADDVSAGRLDRTVPEEGPDEVHRVSRAFNTMTASLRETLERLSHHESLAAMGELAASLAHEVRNPLTSVQMNLARLKKRLATEEGSEEEEMLAQALGQLERLEASVTDALSLARSGRAALSPVDLRDVLEAAAAAAEPRFAERKARLEMDGMRVRAKGDAGMLERLFLNLFLNAAEVLPAGGRAGVRVKKEEGMVRVEVWDEGPGMTPEMRERALEPFFSTKPRGTGLGLPIARRIARSHGGDLELESEPGGGTTVSVTLPADRNGG